MPVIQRSPPSGSDRERSVWATLDVTGAKCTNNSLEFAISKVPGLWKSGERFQSFLVDTRCRSFGSAVGLSLSCTLRDPSRIAAMRSGTCKRVRARAQTGVISTVGTVSQGDLKGAVW